MKNYRLLAPFVMIAFFALGIYMVSSENTKLENKFNASLAAARDFAAQELDVYAVQNYRAAIALKPELDVYLELAQYYRSRGQSSAALSWGENILDNFPKEPRVYELLVELNLEREAYGECYKYFDTVKAKGYMTERINEIMKEIEYYYYTGTTYDEVAVFSGNYAAYRDGEWWGYLNSGCKKAIGTNFLYAGPFYLDMAPVIDREGNAYYIDTSGNKIYNVKDEKDIVSLGLMENDIYSVYNGTVWNFYKKNEGLLYGGFTDASVIGGGVFAAQKDGVWNLYNASGEKLTEEGFEDVIRDEKNVAYRNGRFIVKKNGAYILVDNAGQQHGTESYEDAKLFNESSYAAVKKDGLWGFVDNNGEWIVKPAYEDARSFMNGYAGVMMNGLWGFINSKDYEICIECVYDDVKEFNGRGMTFVLDNGGWTVLKFYKDNH